MAYFLREPLQLPDSLGEVFKLVLGDLVARIVAGLTAARESRWGSDFFRGLIPRPREEVKQKRRRGLWEGAG